jgi:taspase (threonine aspartase 1)
MSDWLLAVHTGAGRYGSSNEAAHLSLLRAALESTHQVLSSSTSPLTAAQIAVHLLHSFEHSSLTNAGLGSNLTQEGRVECEASVACGQTHFVSCCGSVRGVKEPSALALKLLEQAEGGDSSATFAFGRQPPLVVVGEHARQLARRFGLETATDEAEELEEYQVTSKAREQWSKWHRRFQDAETEATDPQAGQLDEEALDTVGAICMDPTGNVAAALSSGGVAYKVPGRLGLAGCPRVGCDAANAVPASGSRKRKRSSKLRAKNAFAVACTGRGEHFVRSNFVGTLTRRLEKSADLERALRKAFEASSEANGGLGVEGGVLALVSAPSVEEGGADGTKSRRVQLGAAFTTPCMGVGFLRSRAGAEPDVHVQLLRRPGDRRSPSKDAQQLAVHVSFLSLGGSPQGRSARGQVVRTARPEHPPE